MTERPANRLLTLMPRADYARLMEEAEQVRMPLRTILAEPGDSLRHAHFPISCVISTVVPMEDGSAVEASTVGNEGMSGVDLLVDRPCSPYRTMQQIEGDSIRVPAEHFRKVIQSSHACRSLIERYLLTLIHQSSQTAACNLRHAVEQRMCRWLLMTHDRVCDDTFYLTHEYLSFMLGVRRQTISEVAATLQKMKLIAYRRGTLTILDRPALESAACECYEAVRTSYQRVMGVPDGCDEVEPAE